MSYPKKNTFFDEKLISQFICFESFPIDNKVSMVKYSSFLEKTEIFMLALEGEKQKNEHNYLSYVLVVAV